MLTFGEVIGSVQCPVFLTHGYVCSFVTIIVIQIYKYFLKYCSGDQYLNSIKYSNTGEYLNTLKWYLNTLTTST